MRLRRLWISFFPEWVWSQLGEFRREKGGRAWREQTYAFCTFEFRKFACAVDFEAGTEHFDFIGVHCFSKVSFGESKWPGWGLTSVGDHDFAVLHTLW